MAGKARKLPLSEDELKLAYDLTLREAAWKISELRGAQNDPKRQISKAWLHYYLSKNGLVQNRKGAWVKTRLRAASKNGGFTLPSGPRMANEEMHTNGQANAPKSEVMGENGQPLSPASTGPEISVGAIQENGSPGAKP